MISKKLMRIAAIVVCLGFITLAVSGVAYATDKKVRKPDVNTFLKKPMLLLNSIFSIFLSPTNQKASTDSGKNSNSGEKIKTTGNLKSDRVADGD